MIIGIDISSIQYGTGVSNYTLNLVKNLIKIDKANTYKLFYASLRNPLPKDILKLGSNRVKIYDFKIPISFFVFIGNKLNIIPIELFIGKLDIFHTSDYYHTPSLKAKLITTVHDLTPFLYPNWLHPSIVKNHRLKFKHIQKYDHFICVSQTTQNDLIKLFPKIQNKTSIVYEASEEKYKKFFNSPTNQKQKIIDNFKRKYKLTDFILTQGTREPRKNLTKLVKAFIKFKKLYPTSTLDLTITGKYGWGKDILTEQPSYIKILGYLAETDMVPAHASALALAYPSLYEGFGLPVLKAMAVGTPVITSLNTSMAEICQDSALLVNPKSTNSILKAITKIYQDKDLRFTLSKKGIALANKFSWTKTAKQTLKIYEKLI